MVNYVGNLGPSDLDRLYAALNAQPSVIAALLSGGSLRLAESAVRTLEGSSLPDPGPEQLAADVRLIWSDQEFLARLMRVNGPITHATLAAAWGQLDELYRYVLRSYTLIPKPRRPIREEIAAAIGYKAATIPRIVFKAEEYLLELILGGFPGLDGPTLIHVRRSAAECGVPAVPSQLPNFFGTLAHTPGFRSKRYQLLLEWLNANGHESVIAELAAIIARDDNVRKRVTT